MDVHSQGIAEELEDEGSDLVFPETAPRNLAASAHLLDSGRDQLYQVTYRLATDQQIKGLFRRKRPVGDLLQPSNFLGRPCYELWTKGSLAGVAVLGFSGMEFSDEIDLTVTLDAVYLANSSRGRGWSTPFGRRWPKLHTQWRWRLLLGLVASYRKSRSTSPLRPSYIQMVGRML